MATKTLTFELFGKDRSASKAIHGVHGELGRGGEQFKRWGKAAALAAAGAAAAFVKFAFDGVKSLARIETINAQTTAAIKSTGGAAGVTTEHVEGLAGSLEKLTATEAETIQEGANMLLTFKNIRNEAGAGNDVFDQSVTALVDMSRAMGTDAKSAAIQLGKALNDPIGGLSALTRVGIQFTDDQKAVIKSLVETGDVAGAQKIILEELNSQFGGSGAAFAETYAGKIELIGHKFGEVQEEVALRLMPHLETFAGWMETDGLKAVEDFSAVLGDVQTALEGLSEEEWFKGIIEELGEGGSLDLATGGFVDNLKAKWDELPDSFANGWEQIKTANVTASDEIAAQFEQSAADWGAKFANGREQINTGVSEWWTGLISQFANGGTQISTWWSQGWTDMGTKLDNGRDQINEGVAGLWDQIMASFSNGWTQISTWWTQGWVDLGTKLENGRQQINTGVSQLVDGMLSKFANGWEQIKGVFSGASKVISDIATGVGRTFASVARTIRTAFAGIGKFISDAFGPIGDFLGGAGNAIRDFFGGTGDAARNIKGRLQAAAYRAPSGGAALARVRATLPSGLRITDTLSNPARDAMFGLQRSANSYHYDANNPAVDIAGPIPLLHQYARQLMAMGGWRQFLWQTAGHYDHIHVAHGGGLVSSSWPRMPGDRADERTARLQVGETVVPRSGGRSETVEEHIHVHMDGKEVASAIRRYERGKR